MIFSQVLRAVMVSSITGGLLLSLLSQNISSFFRIEDITQVTSRIKSITNMELTNGESIKHYFWQYSDLPEPSEENLGEIVQYVGNDSNNYINGMFYKCVVLDESTSPLTYDWQILFASVTDYVTPEMFGAKADGVSNDADAFRKAFEASSTVYLNESSYFLGEEKIDLSSKSSIEIIGKNRQSTIIGGTFIVNIDSTWSRDNKGHTATQPMYPLHISGVRFNKNHSNSPAIVCACPVLIENCSIIYYHRFLAMPNTCYVDRVNFLECNFYLAKEDYASGTLIVGCDDVDKYSDWNGHGDDWLFRNCSMTPIAKQVPLFHASNGNHSITFENCINPCICYGSDNTYKDLPCIFFRNCHFENQHNPCFPKNGYINDKAVVNYSNCYFHSYVKFNEDDVFSGVNYYTSKKDGYSLNNDVGLLPTDLDKFVGVIIPYGSKFKHQKYYTTKYAIPSIREINISSEKSPKRLSVSQILEEMDYVFYYSDNSSTYDVSTKIIRENITPNKNDFNLWNIDISEDKSFYLHVFRRNHSTGNIQKCVMYVGGNFYNDSSINYRFQDGGNSIEGLYKWVDYDGTFPE